MNLSAPGLAGVAAQSKFSKKSSTPHGIQPDPSCNSGHPERHHRTQYSARRVPADGFGLEYIYATGRTVCHGSSGTVPRGGAKAAAVPSNPSPGVIDRRAGACAPDRCFGISVITWQPQLAACARGIKIGIIDTGGRQEPSRVCRASISSTRTSFRATARSHPTITETASFSLGGQLPPQFHARIVPDATFLSATPSLLIDEWPCDVRYDHQLKELNWLQGAGVDIANLSFAGPPDSLFMMRSRNSPKRELSSWRPRQRGPGRTAELSRRIQRGDCRTAVDRNLAALRVCKPGQVISMSPRWRRCVDRATN